MHGELNRHHPSSPVIYSNGIVLRHRGGWSVPLTQASHINGTLVIRNRPKSYKPRLYLFYRALILCCLKLAIAFDAQDFPHRVSHRCSMGPVHDWHRVCCCLSRFCLRCVSHVHEPVYGHCNNQLILTLVCWTVLASMYEHAAFDVQ